MPTSKCFMPYIFSHVNNNLVPMIFTVKKLPSASQLNFVTTFYMINTHDMKDGADNIKVDKHLSCEDSLTRHH